MDWYWHELMWNIRDAMAMCSNTTCFQCAYARSHTWQFLCTLTSLLHAGKYVCMHAIHGTIYSLLMTTLSDTALLTQGACPCACNQVNFIVVRCCMQVTPLWFTEDSLQLDLELFFMRTGKWASIGQVSDTSIGTDASLWVCECVV